MKVVRLESAHLTEVARVETECFSEPWSESSLELLLSEAATGVVCILDGETVGYGGMLWAPDEGQITNIAVSAAWRGKGVGSAVLAELIAQAREKRCQSISLEVRESNASAISLYEKYGFFVAGRRKRFYKNPSEDALVMLLTLNYE